MTFSSTGTVLLPGTGSLLPAEVTENCNVQRVGVRRLKPVKADAEMFSVTFAVADLPPASKMESPRSPALVMKCGEPDTVPGRTVAVAGDAA